MTGDRKPAHLIRTRGGLMVHREDCRYAETRGVPWLWAGGKTHSEIRAAVLKTNMSVCHICRPTDGRGVIPW